MRLNMSGLLCSKLPVGSHIWSPISDMWDKCFLCVHQSHCDFFTGKGKMEKMILAASISDACLSPILDACLSPILQFSESWFVKGPTGWNILQKPQSQVRMRTTWFRTNLLLWEWDDLLLWVSVDSCCSVTQQSAPCVQMPNQWQSSLSAHKQDQNVWKSSLWTTCIPWSVFLPLQVCFCDTTSVAQSHGSSFGRCSLNAKSEATKIAFMLTSVLQFLLHLWEKLLLVVSENMQRCHQHEASPNSVDAPFLFWIFILVHHHHVVDGLHNLVLSLWFKAVQIPPLMRLVRWPAVVLKNMCSFKGNCENEAIVCNLGGAHTQLWLPNAAAMLAALAGAWKACFTGALQTMTVQPLADKSLAMQGMTSCDSFKSMFWFKPFDNA